MAKNIGFDTKNKSCACSEPKLQFHSLKSSLAFYSPSNLFLTFRSIWGPWKWSQLIPHTQKHGDRHQNQVSSITASKVRNLHPEVVLDLLQPLHPILGLQVNLGVLKNSPKWFPIPKNMGLDTKIKSLEGSEEFWNFRPWFCWLPIFKRPKMGEKSRKSKK